MRPTERVCLLLGEFLDELLKVPQLREEIQVIRTGGPLLMCSLFGAIWIHMATFAIRQWRSLNIWFASPVQNRVRGIRFWWCSYSHSGNFSDQVCRLFSFVQDLSKLWCSGWIILVLIFGDSNSFFWDIFGPFPRLPWPINKVHGRWSLAPPHHVATAGNSFIGTPGCSYDRSHRCGTVTAEFIRLNHVEPIYRTISV